MAFTLRVLAVAILLDCFTLEPVAMTQVTTPISPTALVDVSPIVPGQSPAAVVAFFTPELSPLMPASFLLTNKTDRSIVGILVFWVTIDDAGQKIAHRYACDSFLDTRTLPVLGPRSTMLVAPQIWIALEQLPRYRKTPAFSANDQRLRRVAQKFRNAASVSVRIDSIIFSDGEVVGPDNWRFADEISSRTIAASKILQAVRTATANGQPASSALAAVAHQPVIRGEHLATWERRFARQLLKAPDVSQTLRSLENLPPVPAFFRRPESATQ